MFKRLICNGCSFNGPRKTSNPPVEEFVSSLLSNFLEIPLTNLARGGRGNRKIVDHTKIYFEKNKNHKKDSLCLIQWSSPLRRDYPTTRKRETLPNFDTNFRTWNDTKEIKFIKSKKNWDLNYDYALSQITNIIDLQSYFVVNEIKYVMYFGLPNSIKGIKLNSDLNALNNSIDYNTFFKPDDTHYDFVIRNHLICSKDDPHPSLEGHTLWTGDLFDFVSKKFLK